jgi:hypothetical protein
VRRERAWMLVMVGRVRSVERMCEPCGDGVSLLRCQLSGNGRRLTTRPVLPTVAIDVIVMSIAMSGKLGCSKLS